MTENVERPHSDPASGPADDPASGPVSGSASGPADDREHRLDPRSVTAARVSGGIFLLVLGAAQLIALLVMTFAGAGIWTLLVLAIVVANMIGLGILLWFWPALRYRYAAYRVNERGIHNRDGVLWRSIVSVPRSRVQHTDVSQGPLARAYGLATLIIHTAGTEHASVSLDGLPRDKAYAIRDHLIDGGEDDAV
jgi:membrane protein YdbS with pleckstrin-like domain